MDGWHMAGLGVILIDLAVPALALRRRTDPAWLGALDALANLASLTLLLSWLRWGGGVDAPGATLGLLAGFYAWSLATAWIVDWHFRRPLGRLRFLLAIADAACIALVAAQLLHDRPAPLLAGWLAMAAGYAATAAVFRRHVPADWRGALTFGGLAVLLVAAAPLAVRPDMGGWGAPPPPTLAAGWVALAPGLAWAGVRRRSPLLCYLGIGMAGILAVRALYDCHPRRLDPPLPGHAAGDGAPPPLPKDAAPPLRNPITPTPGAEEGPAGVYVAAEDDPPVRERKLERILEPVRPWWLMAMAPASIALTAGALRRDRRRGAAGAPSADGAAPLIDPRFADGAVLAAGVATLFFAHLEWTAWLTARGAALGRLYTVNAAGTAALWSLASWPFQRARVAGARWTAFALLAVGWIAAGSLAWRAWGLAGDVPAWFNLRLPAYACVFVATAAWTRGFARPDQRRAARRGAIAFAAACLAGEIAAGIARLIA